MRREPNCDHFRQRCMAQMPNIPYNSRKLRLRKSIGPYRCKHVKSNDRCGSVALILERHISMQCGRTRKEECDMLFLNLSHGGS